MNNAVLMRETFMGRLLITYFTNLLSEKYFVDHEALTKKQARVNESKN
jgi:hypothetical protein